MVVPVNKINAYYIACRICFIFLLQHYQEDGFRGFCLWFGPNVWDLLVEENKILLKNISIRYKTNPMARQERNFGRLSPGAFLQSIFDDEEYYLDYFYNLFVPYLNADVSPLSVFRW